eukprot:3298075-Rhodomonas_salina.1
MSAVLQLPRSLDAGAGSNTRRTFRGRCLQGAWTWRWRCFCRQTVPKAALMTQTLSPTPTIQRALHTEVHYPVSSVRMLGQVSRGIIRITVYCLMSVPSPLRSTPRATISHHHARNKVDNTG